MANNKRVWAGVTRHLWSHAQRHGLGSRSIARFAHKYLGWYENHDYQMERNGELRLLEMLASLEPRILFDVGANVGEWSAYALEAIPGIQRIHAFEIAPSVAKKFTERFLDEPRVIANGHGLSDERGEQPIDFYVDGTHSGTTMMVDARLHTQQASERQSAQVETGDNYCERHGIAHIDFLKIDVEGAEPRVLAGFQRMLSSQAVSLVQFEYNSINIGTRFLLRDFYTLLEGHGYIIGKLWPRGVSFGSYDFRSEDFIGPNYVAVADSQPRLMQSLTYRPKAAAS